MCLFDNDADSCAPPQSVSAWLFEETIPRDAISLTSRSSIKALRLQETDGTVDRDLGPAL